MPKFRVKGPNGQTVAITCSQKTLEARVKRDDLELVGEIDSDGKLVKKAAGKGTAAKAAGKGTAAKAAGKGTAAKASGGDG